jgi:hypothetical protein
MTKPYHRYSESGVRFIQYAITNFDELPYVNASSQWSWANVADGVTMPNWRDLISRQTEAGTPFQAFSIECENTPGVLDAAGFYDGIEHPAHFRSKTVWGDFNGADLRGNIHQGLSDSEAISIAASQFYDRAHSAVVAIEGGELLGEIGQTVQEIKRLATDATSLFSDWRRTIRRARKIKKTGRAVAGIISDAYLRWKFGWDPLVKDAKALANDLKDDFLEVQTIKAAGKSTYTHSVQTFPLGLNQFLTCEETLKRSETTSVRHKAGIALKRYGVGGLAETLGLSPRNFLPTVYNLLPWTYMIDYFSNLGSIVNAIAFSNMDIRWASTTTRREAQVEIVSGVNPAPIPAGIPDWKSLPGYPICNPSRVVWKSKSVLRQVTAPEVPQFRLKLPNFASTGGKIQGTNIIAVLASMTWGSREMSRFRNG